MTDVDLDSGDPPWAEDEAPERDENTDDMFGAPVPAPESRPAAEPKPVEPIPVSTPAPVEGDGEAYTVLARKYRP